MMELSEIAAASREWAELASKEKEQPFIFYNEEEVKPPWKFPTLGTYRPKGWRLVKQLFCDSSGYGSPHEPALTSAQQIETFRRYVNKDKTYGFGILEAGEFQCLIGVFVKQNPKQKTH